MPWWLTVFAMVQSVINGYIIGLDVQLIAVLDSAVIQLAVAAALVVEIVIIAGIIRNGRTTGHVQGCAAFDHDVFCATHPYCCIAQVQRSAVYIDVAGHGTVVVAEKRAPCAAIKRSDVVDPAACAVLRSLCHPAHHHK